MKIIKRLFFVLVLISSICLISCGSSSSSSGDDGDKKPDYYVSFEGESYSSNGYWTAGLEGVAEGNPFCALGGTETNGYGFYETGTVANWKSNSIYKFVAIGFIGEAQGLYTATEWAWISIRPKSQTDNSAVTLTNPSIDVKIYSEDFIEGEFSGDDADGKQVSGTFRFKNIGNTNWKSK